MVEEPPRRHQHLVSNGYQKNFADKGRISVLDARTGRVLEGRKSTKENWSVQDFLSVLRDGEPVDDQLEKDFANDERTVLNQIRDIRRADGVTTDQKASLDRLAAIHLIRSHRYRDEHDVVVKNWLNGDVLKLSQDPRLRQQFVRQHGRAPADGELETLVATTAQSFGESPDLFAGGVRRGVDSISELLAKSSVQLIEAHEDLPGFILADNPVLHGDRDLGRFGFRAAGAVGDADLIIVPIQRRLVAIYTRRRLRHLELRTKEGLNWINSLLIRGATAEVACHPSDAKYVSQLIRGLARYPAEGFVQATIR